MRELTKQSTMKGKITLRNILSEKFKRRILILTVLAIVLSISAVAADIHIFVDGNPLEFDVQPRIINGRTMVPLRTIFEAMGATVEWDAHTQTVTATSERAIVKATINKKELTVNGTPVDLDVAPQIVDGRTLVPARFVAESFGADVTWVQASSTVTITSCKSDNFFTGDFSARSRKLYSLDGREVEVGINDLAAYKKVYWYDEPVILMYAVGSKRAVVKQSNIEAQKKVGWYEYPVTQMYAADGRTAAVATSKVEEQKHVGWYTYPVDTIYLKDGQTKIIETADLAEYLELGWSTEPFVVLYSTDGRTCTVKQSQVEAQKKVGWYEKEELDEMRALQSNQKKIQSKVYSSKHTGSVTGVITWQYNKYVGTKADVGAQVFLIQKNKLPLEEDSSTFWGFHTDDPTVLSTTVDGMGNYYFDNVPAGDYYILIISKATTAMPAIAELECTLVTSCLKGLVATKGLEVITDRLALYNGYIDDVTVENGKTVRISKDWGYTYISLG